MFKYSNDAISINEEDNMKINRFWAAIFLVPLALLVSCVVVSYETRTTVNYSYEYASIEKQCKEGNKTVCAERIKGILTKLDQDDAHAKALYAECGKGLKPEDARKYCGEDDFKLKLQDLQSWREKFLKLKQDSGI